MIQLFKPDRLDILLVMGFCFFMGLLSGKVHANPLGSCSSAESWMLGSPVQGVGDRLEPAWSVGLDTVPPKSQRVELEIDGLVIDDTRSKIGRDFYDQFYSRWVAPEGASDFIITIREFPARGRLVQVGVLVNDDELARRFLQPREELITATANLFIRAARQRLEQKQALREQLEDPDQKGSGIF